MSELTERIMAALENHNRVLLPTIQELMSEAWAEGAATAWEASGEGWNGEYPGEPFDNNEIPNPYEPTP